MDSLKFHLGPLCLTLLMVVSGVAHLQDGWLAAIFYSFGLWSVASGLWPVACGLWPVACGLWPVACGLWPVACGLWSEG
jgi:hypothetical protein